MLMLIQVWGGAALLAVMALQVLTGMRKPGLFGKRRLKVHRVSGYALLALAVAHGVVGFWIAYGPIG